MLRLLLASKLPRLRYANAFSSLKSHYEVLEVGEGASFKEIKEKYLAKSKTHHPDISPNSQELYQDIQSAYKVLISPHARKKYDLSLGIQYSPWEKQIIGHKFNTQFQSEALYEQILKGQQQQNAAHPQSMEEKLQRDFKTEIDAFSYTSLFKSIGFISMILGTGLIWVLWNGVEIVYLGYAGTVTHKIEEIHTETALKVVPLVSR